MTRINVVPVRELSDKHLVAEYRELPRVFRLSYEWQQRNRPTAIPAEYTLGKGHVTFFYDKLRFLIKRHRQLCREMRHRLFVVRFPDPPQFDHDDDLMKQYEPTPEALRINRERINKRLNGDKS